MQFRNIDLKGPERVRIQWAMETPTDETCDNPLDRDEGFFPSQDPESPGYIGDVSQEEFERQFAEAQQRLDDFHAGEWEYVGVIAVARVYVPIGGGSYTIHEFRSAGLWGIESNAGAYLDEVFEDEKASLLDNLKTLGAALASGDFEESDA